MNTTLLKILVIYTGGTIGMIHRDPSNPKSPLIPASWEDLKSNIGTLEELPIEAKVVNIDPVDSSDIAPDDWLKIASIIQENHHDCEGIVVLHGTDTMTYTA